MGGSMRFGEYFGIELRIHWTFLVLLAWIGLAVLGRTGSVVAAVSSIVLLGTVFLCVALHEYGHALVARHYGIATLEITLLPIGGIARLARIPSDPKEELWIALAGPAVNFAIAGILVVIHLLAGGVATGLFGGDIFDSSLVGMLFQLNIIMGLFNLLPALPMDGGRVLRAILTFRMPALRATRIAANVARGLAAAMVAFGLVQGNVLLAIIGGFVWMAARSEYALAQVEHVRRQNRRPSGVIHSAEDGTTPPGEWIQGSPSTKHPRID